MMQSWFSEAKLGIFIHWGLYSVKGIPESWSIFNKQISYDDYMTQLDGFTASQYDPDAWADLFKRAGARYAVLTTKHHDGFALWPTQLSDLNVTHTPAQRDLVGPFAESLRKAGLHTGLYFSHLDWSHPDYASTPANVRNYENVNHDTWTQDESTWQRFLKFHRGQLEELCKSYKPELLWFDGDWTPTAEYWNMAQLRDQLHAWAPGVILNARMHGYGDYLTPEQGFPITQPEGPWEFCATINDSWGYQPHDTNYKSARQLVRMFAECIGMGGNLLLDIGPKADGSIPEEQVARLEELGAWIHKNAEAVYPTTAGLQPGLFYGASTLTKDRKTLYLFNFDRPWDSIAVKGIRNNVTKVSILSTGQELTYNKIGGASWMNIPGILWIDVPDACNDPLATVIKVELEGELDLYTGAGQAISQN